ncbi:MAG TPA: PRC-barrel domain-containing protein [Syntrophomonadaceae bacterium]|nr:PRC-barrel domain-containing protein [Syntrophomonadaceae bacterium]
MKKSQEIIGLPVFSIINGMKIGQVKDLVINPEEAKVDFILVGNDTWYVGARVLPFKDVMGIGEHAVTIESEATLMTITDVGTANNLLERNIEVKGNRVLTNKGNLIGVISEYEIDENTGKLYKLEYKTAQDETKIDIIMVADVLTFGADVVVVKERPDNSDGDLATFTQELDQDTTNLQSSGATLFKEKQKEYLIGQTLIKDIKDADGKILFAIGLEITEEVLELAEQQNKFIELSQSIK